MTPTMPRSPANASSAVTHQIYVTHCLHSEGVFRQAGFNVRACSTRDPLLLRFALDYPTYELPLGVGAGDLAPGAAPRRLALVRIPGGRTALIHSTYLPDDSSGRANNFFSHVLVRPALRLREALLTWGSPDWATGCDAATGQDLPPLSGLPRPGPLSDEAVTAFLQAEPDADGADATAPAGPERPAGASRRREVLAVALRGCLRALRADPGAPRGRFFILAEPGLTAFLLYAAARLLPDALADRLTFSTYENAHRDLRTFKHAVIVGTCTADPAKGLEQEFFSSRGYALDTFNHAFSPELASEDEAPVEEWLDLAARGGWATIDKARRLIGDKAHSLLSLKEGLRTAKFLRRLAAGEVGAGDLLALKRSSWGVVLLEQHRARLWPLVRDGSLASARLREEFAEVLREHVPELEQRAAQALRAEPAENWQPHWRLLCSLLQGDPARLRDACQRVLPEPPYLPALRLGLLQELEHLPLSPLDPRLPLHRLLRGCSAEELDGLAGSALPREWFVLALCYAVLKPETRAAAVRHLHGGDAALLRALGEQFQLLKDEGQRRAILAQLCPPGTAEAALFLSRLLRTRCGLRPETLEWLLDSLGAWGAGWAEFWDRDNHRGLLFDLLRASGDEAGSLWDRFCGRIDPEVLLPGSAAQTALLRDLAAARDRPGPALPAKAAQAIADWVLLRDHFLNASAVPDEARPAIIEACNRRGLNAIETLARYFDRFVRPQGMNRDVLEDFAGFFHSFYAAGTDYTDNSSRLVGWLEVVGVCADEQLRASYHQYYVERFVPPQFRERLAGELHQAGKLLTPVPEAGPRPTEPAPRAPAAEPAPGQTGPPPGAGPGDTAFQLSGAHPPGSDCGCRRWSALQRFAWLLCGAGGGTLAAVVCGLHPAEVRRTPALALFVPLVVLMAETMATQAVAVAGPRLRRGEVGGPGRLRSLGKELLVGLVLGLGCGLLVGAGAAAWFGPGRLAWCLGGSVAGGMAVAAALGVGIPAALALLKADRWAAAGPVARALATGAAVFLYVSLARWLLA